MQKHELYRGALLEIVGRSERLNQCDGECEYRYAR
jgi:hypothetical protein